MNSATSLQTCVLALGAAFAGVGCSLADFGYLSADFGQGGGGAGAAGASGGTLAEGGAGGAGMGAQAGAAATAGSSASGSAGSAGSGGSGPEPYFCAANYAVFHRADTEPPPVALPEDGDYVVHKHDTSAACLVTPDWPELGDKQYFAITEDCGGPGTPNPHEPDQLWHLERLCSDVYRISVNHGAASERHLGVVDHTMVGTPLYSVEATPSIDPSFLFQPRFEELVGETVRWRFSPVVQSSSCVEQSGMERYGDVDVTRVVLFPCTGSVTNQSWNLLPVP